MDFHERYKFNPKTDFLGKGGFSKVYKAYDTLLQRTVALKFFTGSNLGEKYQVLSEIRKVIHCVHPNLCKYYDVALLTSKNIMDEMVQVEVGIMEYIDAGDFKTYTRKHPQHVDKLLIDVLKGLAYLHKNKIVHRDLKPQNILIKIDEDEPVSKITDFGISKLIDTDEDGSSTLLGTIEYMAPEQFNTKKYGINGRIATNLDLWSFGLLVYEAICHQSFFGRRSGGISPEQVMANILNEDSLEKADTLPLKYREIVKRCLVKNAADRVRNALELIPLFDENITAVENVQPVRESTRDARTRKEMPVPEPTLKQTGDSNAAAETSAEETPVTDLMPEPTSTQTQVNASMPETPTESIQPIEPGLDTMDETELIDTVSEGVTEPTEGLEFPQSETAEETEVIAPTPERVDAQAAGPDRTKITIGEKEKFPPKQPDDEKEPKKEKRKPVKKIILLSSVAVLLSALFIVYAIISLSEVNKKLKPVNSYDSKSAHVASKSLIPEVMPVKGNTFTMGDPDAQDAALQAHEVTLSDFSLGKYEVTVAQFEMFIQDSGYTTTAQHKGSSLVYESGNWMEKKGINWRHDALGHEITSNKDSIPVVHVSWVDANAYCKWLSDETSTTYRLPTEAEWEFAAQNGNNADRFLFSGSNRVDSAGWYKDNSDERLHPIGKKLPNALGLYDLTGNALEWCNDWYDAAYYKNSPKVNPMGPHAPAADSVKVLRGGAWGFEKEACRNVHRHGFKADESGGSTGFRVCEVNK